MTGKSNALGSVRPAKDWKPESWQKKPAAQQAKYPDADALDDALRQLADMPPLVTSWEVISLKQQLAEAAEGKRFLLQGGDCAESFAECTPDVISNRLKVLLQMSLVLVHGLQMPVVRVGRFAGQYAKPRSADFETRDGVTLPSYRGDLVNDIEFTPEARNPDPRRLIRAHARSAMTMNFVRGLVDGGFADLHHPEYWDLAWVDHSPLAAEYQRMVQSVADSVKFMETLAGRRVGALSRVDFYTSHEGLHLLYEQAQTRQVPRQWGWFNLSTHFPWIGMRTAKVDGAHVEYCRGIRNPLGIKVGPGMTADWLGELLDILNPENEAGRITLIHRMGADRIGDHLPQLIECVRERGHKVLWSCDPMHGNTEKTENGVKTRRFEKIRGELEQAFDIHAACGSRLGAVHLELTGENVTECTGGARELTDGDLGRAYKSTVDPRLNYEQALEMAMLIVRKRSSLVDQTAIG
ncbi:MAG: 3-deoxy-7-phosphoheptulonate synthase class II [Xanthomonadales bacterium]|nr:3-deoxy-7-phosphoheptulonate synthase class II [Xanthomonadales bacterium]